MKYIIIFILSVLAIPALAQDPSWKRPSWWNDSTVKETDDSINNKRSKVSVITENSNENIVAQSVKSSLSLIRQQYRLKRNGDYYGKNNMPYYGETYSIGVKVSGGMFLLSDVVEPWKNDEDYKRVNESKKYKPVLFWSYQRLLSDSTYKAIELEIGSEFFTPVNNDSSLYIHTEAHPDFGLSIDYTSGQKSGYMIWAYTCTNLQDSAMSVKLTQSQMSIEINPDSTDIIPLSTNDNNKILGGIYVVPNYDQHKGIVQYKLVGVAIKDDNSKWFLQPLATKSNITKSGDNDNKSDNNKRSKRNKKKDNEENESSEPTKTKK
ncbi:MAG: hypothetical protein Q4D41_08385 [Prevotellaceae bacterium]|nr:hypothetical protein [Prevotellaceae bacterium]